MSYLFTTPNPYAPDYEPEIWNAGVIQAKRLPSVVKSFCESAGFYAPANISYKGLLTCFDIVRKIKVSPADVLTESKEYVEDLLNLPIEAAVALHSAVEPYLNFAPFKNCYAYSRDDKDPTISMRKSAMPGERSGAFFPRRQIGAYSYSEYRDFLIERSERDGLEYVGLEPQRREGSYLTALFVAKCPDTGDRDFHYMREDSDGKFSHKMGVGAVNRLDDRRKEIQDPAEARFGFYNTYYKFEGYFLNPGKLSP